MTRSASDNALGKPSNGTATPPKVLGQFLGPPLGAVGDRDLPDAGVGQRAGHHAAGVAGADYQGAAVIQP